MSSSRTPTRAFKCRGACVFCFYYESQNAVLRGKLNLVDSTHSLSPFNESFIVGLHFKFLSTLHFWNREARNYFATCDVVFLGGAQEVNPHPCPSDGPRVEPEFPLSLWIRVRRGMLARMVTVSGHRGPGALKPLRLKPVVGAAGPVAVAVDT